MGRSGNIICNSRIKQYQVHSWRRRLKHDLKKSNEKKRDYRSHTFCLQTHKESSLLTVTHEEKLSAVTLVQEFLMVELEVRKFERERISWRRQRKGVELIFQVIFSCLRSLYKTNAVLSPEQMGFEIRFVQSHGRFIVIMFLNFCIECWRILEAALVVVRKREDFMF